MGLGQAAVRAFGKRFKPGVGARLHDVQRRPGAKVRLHISTVWMAPAGESL